MKSLYAISTLFYLIQLVVNVHGAIKQRTNGIQLPIVLWHGMGDTCCNPLSMGSLVKLIEENIQGVNVTSLKIGSSTVQDFESGYFKNINDQIDYVCQLLQSDPIWQSGYHAVGISQGGLFLRGVAERCPTPPMVNLISIGGPQQGVYGLPHCPGAETVCDEIRNLLNKAAYEPFLQDFLVQAQYWHDPLNEALYMEESTFLADINNNKLNKTSAYKDNLLKLANLVLVMFTKDTMVEPKESEWFGFYDKGQAQGIHNLTNSELYTEDWIGLKQLDQSGRLHFLTVEGDHIRFSAQWFIDNIITPYLKQQ